jgi:hypothetical protein
MKAQSINLSGICSIRPPHPASRQAHPTGRGASRAAEHYPQNKTPQIAGSCQAHRTAGIGGIGAIRARLVNVSRASSKEVQKSLAGLRVIHRWRVRPTSPAAAVDGVVRSILVNPGTKPGRAKREGHSFMLARSKLGCVMR